MTENQIASDIENIASSGSLPVDFKIERSQISYWINQTRSMLVSQDIQKRKDISDVWIQTISCQDLEQVDKSECCEIETGCTILKSPILPRTIEVNGTNSIIRVTDMMGNKIDKTTYAEVSVDGHNKFTSKKPKWYLKNDRIYVINSDFLSKINIDLLAENPSDLAAYATCDGSTCYSINSDYPCSLKMASEITNIVLKTKVYPFLQLPQDTTNNADNQPNQQPNTRRL